MSMRVLPRLNVRSVVELEIHGSFLVPSRKPCTAVAIVYAQSGSEWVEYFRTETVLNSTHPSFQKPCYFCDYHFKETFKVAMYDIPMKLSTQSSGDSAAHNKKPAPTDTHASEFSPETCYGEIVFPLKDLFSRQTLQIAKRLTQPAGLPIPSGFVQLKGHRLSSVISIKVEISNLPSMEGEYYFRVFSGSPQPTKGASAYRSESTVHPYERDYISSHAESAGRDSRRMSVLLFSNSLKKSDSKISWMPFFLSGRWIESKPATEKITVCFYNRTKVIVGDTKTFASQTDDGGVLLASASVAIGDLMAGKPKSASIPIIMQATSLSKSSIPQITPNADNQMAYFQMECSYFQSEPWKPVNEKSVTSDTTQSDEKHISHESATLSYPFFLQRSFVPSSFPVELNPKVAAEPVRSKNAGVKARPKSATDGVHAPPESSRALESSPSSRPKSSNAYKKRFTEVALKKAQSRFDEESRASLDDSKSPAVDHDQNVSLLLPNHIMKRNAEDLTSHMLKDKDFTRADAQSRIGSTPTKALDGSDKKLIQALEKRPEDRIWEDLKIIYDRALSISCLQDFSRQQQLQVSRVAMYSKSSPGDVLFDKGDNLLYWYLLLDGEVTIQRAVEQSGPSGTEWLQSSAMNLTNSLSTAGGPAMRSLKSRNQRNLIISPGASPSLQPHRTPDAMLRRSSNVNPTRMMKSLTESEMAVVEICKSGDSIGEMYLMHHRSSAVKALVTKPTTFFIIPKTDYETHFKNSHLKEFNEQIEFFKVMSIFEDWSRVSLARLVSTLVSKKYAKEEVVIKYGQPPSFEALYFIQSGSAKLFKMAKVRVRSKEVMPILGEDQKLRLEEDTRPPMFQTTLVHVSDIHKGDFFGQLVLAGDAVREHQFTVICKEEMKVFVVSRSDCQRIFRIGPDEVNRSIEKIRAQIQKYDQDEATVQRIFDEKENERRWMQYKKQLVDGIRSRPRGSWGYN